MDVDRKRALLDNIEEAELLLLVGMAYLLRKRRRGRSRRGRRQIWVKPWIGDLSMVAGMVQN